MFKVLHMEIWYTQVNINYCFLDCLMKAFIILTGITQISQDFSGALEQTHKVKLKIHQDF